MKQPYLPRHFRPLALLGLLLLPSCQTTIVPGPVTTGPTPEPAPRPKPPVAEQPGAMQPIPPPPKPPVAQPLIPLKPEGEDSLMQDKPETPLYKR